MLVTAGKDKVMHFWQLPESYEGLKVVENKPKKKKKIKEGDLDGWDQDN